MSLTQQHLLDTHRARHLGTPVPPAPGTHDARVVRELREYRRFRAVLAGRPARGRIRHVLHRWLHRWPAGC
ncbi:hypothetical protein [Streptomyces sp. SAI-149]|uniref:hypothetical protein n=1 Tax=Streptomyces sp. SAI-149 TaxID=2940542 RepID=UPI002473E946|nr:hypothetical protein [Streptomyces sp. SAI-149]MDH6497509.1 hypothetical protein [Streptomyces sp. SAI-149]